VALLYEEIRQYLLDRIRDGQLRPGDRLPSEHELAEQFGVSRITSKRALQLLGQQGFVVRARGRGTFVSDTLPGVDSPTSHPDTTPAGPDDAAPRPAPGPVPARPRPPIRVAFIVPDIDDVYGAELLRAIEHACGARGYQFLLRRTVGDATVEASAITSYAATGVDGLIVFPIHGEYYNHDLLRLVLDGFPVVLIDRRLPGIAVASVATDNFAAAHKLTDALLDDGHRTIGFVTASPEHTSSIQDRWLGFLAALEARGIDSRRDESLRTMSSTLPGHLFERENPEDRERIRAWLRANPDLTAVLACEYPLARLVEVELAALGRSGVVVACFDSPPDRLGGYAYLHVRQRQWEMGETAVALIAGQIAARQDRTVAPPTPHHVAIPFDLIPATAAR
jgi:DNA-binding LacI/PurR family transcriptional regulator